MEGILILYKEKGCTSHDVVAKVKKICKEKVGHTGTLDPMATGVLPLLIGDATKLSKYLIQHDKKYEVVLQLGIKTDTADGEGSIIEKQVILEENIKQPKVIEILQSLIGKQKQIPPMYSAIKIKGKKLYEYARKGETIAVPERKIEIYEMNLKEMNLKEKTISFEVHCSKGTYIRSLCEDIAKKLGTIGYMKELKRTKVGDFSIQNAITLSEITNEKMVQEHLITMEKFLQDKLAIELNKQQLIAFLNGVPIPKVKEKGIYRVYSNGNFIGSGVVENEKLRRDIIIYKTKADMI